MNIVKPNIPQIVAQGSSTTYIASLPLNPTTGNFYLVADSTTQNALKPFTNEVLLFDGNDFIVQTTLPEVSILINGVENVYVPGVGWLPSATYTGGSSTGGGVSPGDNVSSLVNDAGYLVASALSDYIQEGDNNSLLVNDSNYLTPIDLVNYVANGDNVSQLTNDAGFITSSQAPVQSVNGLQGSVALNTLAVPESGNLYFTQARVNNNVNVLANTAARHDAVTLGAGSDSRLSLLGQELTLSLPSTLVSSINGSTGVVNLSTTEILEGTNLYFTNVRVSNNSDVLANTALRHNPVSIGTANGLSIDASQQLSLSPATGANAGAMSATDKTKLDGLFLSSSIERTSVGSDLTININQTTRTPMPLSGVTLLNGTGFSSVGNTIIQTNFTGQAMFGATVSWVSSASFSGLEMILMLNRGGVITDRLINAYSTIPFSSGVSRTTTSFMTMLNVLPGDSYYVDFTRYGTRTNSIFMVEKPNFWAIRLA